MTSRMTIRRSVISRRNQFNGIAFCSPAILGLLVLTVYPMCASFYYSLCSYSALKPARYVGLANYALIGRDLTHRGLLFESFYNTFYFAVLAVPTGIVVSFVLALLLNQRIRGMAWFRTLFYVPSVVPIVASSVLWMWLLNPQFGLINRAMETTGVSRALHTVGVSTPIGWLSDPQWAKAALVLMSCWAVGNSTVILLAALQGVPQDLYEAAHLDGANGWARTWRVTLPMISPTMLFLLVMGLIGSFQYFTQAWVISAGTGGPANSTLMLPMYLFQNAFQFFKMGYACAIAWVMTLFVGGLTFLVFKTSARYVYYGGSAENG